MTEEMRVIDEIVRRKHQVVVGKCDHTWQPVSFAFETELRGPGVVGNVARQPHIDGGRLFCVCVACHSHTYMVTRWAGFYLDAQWECSQDEFESARESARSTQNEGESEPKPEQ